MIDLTNSTSNQNINVGNNVILLSSQIRSSVSHIAKINIYHNCPKDTEIDISSAIKSCGCIGIRDEFGKDINKIIISKSPNKQYYVYVHFKPIAVSGSHKLSFKIPYNIDKVCEIYYEYQVIDDIVVSKDTLSFSAQGESLCYIVRVVHTNVNDNAFMSCTDGKFTESTVVRLDTGLTYAGMFATTYRISTTCRNMPYGIHYDSINIAVRRGDNIAFKTLPCRFTPLLFTDGNDITYGNITVGVAVRYTVTIYVGKRCGCSSIDIAPSIPHVVSVKQISKQTKSGYIGYDKYTFTLECIADRIGFIDAFVKITAGCCDPIRINVVAKAN